MLDSDVKTTPLSKDQMDRIAIQTCQWWNAVFVQGTRMIDALESGDANWPWNDSENINAYNVERLLLITTIHHALEHLKVLNDELIRRGDNSLSEVYQKVGTPVYEKLNSIRNVNEHQIEYIVLPEKNAKKLYCTTTENGVSLNTNRLQTILLGNPRIFVIGDVDFGKLLISMKEQHPIVKQVTEYVFNSSIIAENETADTKEPKSVTMGVGDEES